MDPTDADFLQRARRGASPTVDDRARVLAATLAALGADALVPNAEQQRAGAAEGSWSSVLARGARGVVAKLVLATLLSGVSGGVGYWLGRTHSAHEAASGHRSDEPLKRASAQPWAPAAPRPASARSELATPVPTESGGAWQLADTPTDVRLPTTPAPSNETARASASAAPVNGKPSASASADEELRLLRRIQRALSDSNPRLALALLGELDQSVPRSQLMEERQAAAVMAGCQLEGDQGARAASARAFERRYPDSLYRGRIRQTCGMPGSREE